MPRIRSLNMHLEQRRFLRRASTRPESVLWEYLRARRFLGLKFRRQYSVGNYVLDFYCPELRLGIELDGAGHSFSAQQQHDDFRTEWLDSMYIHIVRFKNDEVMCDIEGVLETLGKIASTARHPTHPTASHSSSIEEENPAK